MTTADIFPGQQITTGELSVGTTTAIQTQISGAQRAIALPSAGSRGLVGYLADGDRVDIYYETGASGASILALLAPNVLVLRAPTGDGSPIVLRANTALQAQRLALAADTGTLWYLLRPTTGAENPPRRVDLEPAAALADHLAKAERLEARWTSRFAHSSRSSRGSTASRSSEPCPTTPSFQLLGVTHTIDETMRSLREVGARPPPRRLGWAR